MGSIKEQGVRILKYAIPAQPPGSPSRTHSADSAMNAKRKCTRNEHRSILLLERSGYACTGAVASLGIFDVIGIRPTNVVLVQSKTRDWPGSVEMEAIRNFQCPPMCKKIIHLPGPGTLARCQIDMNHQSSSEQEAFYVAQTDLQ